MPQVSIAFNMFSNVLPRSVSLYSTLGGTTGKTFLLIKPSFSNSLTVYVIILLEITGFNPFNTGLFHFCIQDPDIETLVDKIVAAGGKQRMPIRAYYPDDKPYKMCYVEDPFGIVFEIYTHSYELTYSSGAYL